MKTNPYALILLFLMFAGSCLAEEARPLAERQREFLSWKFGMFIHFGVASFNERQWATGHEDPASFAPTQLDCGQWADAAKAAGMKYGVFTVKHTGGWPLWDSQHTTHDITALKNFKNGKGDLVREYVDAFRARGLKIGLYYCLPGDFSRRKNNKLQPGQIDMHGLPPEAAGDYVGFIKKQLTELLTGYGAVDLLWFDQYSNKYTGEQWPEIKAHVHSLQPNCLVLANNSLDFKKTDIHSYEYPLLKAQKRQALPSEENSHPAEVCDCITPGGWFWKTNMTEQSVTSAAEVVSMLKISNSRQANYLLNVPPDRTGRIPQWLVARLREIGQLRQGEAPQKRPLLLANYYCWYHDGRHPKQPFLHWTYPSSATNVLAKKAQKPGEPPPNSVFRPLAGLYDSADPMVAEWHVQLAKAAGIDAFLVDWWDTHNQLDQNVDLGIIAAAWKHGFKFALLDERAQFHQKFEDYQAMLARGLKRYKDNPAYLRIDGRPVVYLYQVATEPGLTAAEFPLLKKHVEGEVGPVYWIVDKISHDAKAANAGDKDREKRIPGDWLATPGVDSFAFYSTFSNFRAHDYESLAGKYRYITKLAHDAGKKMLLPVHPGHDNSHFRDDPYVMPRRDGQTLRDFLRAATDAGADYIMVTSWNEWPESTVVEPSTSWPDPYLYLKILADWKGVPFTEPPSPALKAKQP